MNANEFKTEFNLAYNNLASNQAPGLDEVEISIYLTKAQNMLVDALYGEFEKSEEARRKLANLVVTERLVKAPIENPSSGDTTDTTVIPVSNILYPQYTTVYTPESNVRYIINEQIKMSSNANTCIKGKHLKVQPILHDEIDTIINNPFKFNIRRALRLDTSYNDTPYIEILTKDNHIEYYQIRYVKTPEPIMIYTNAEYPDDTIDGYVPTTTPRLGSLPSTTHRQIVEIAAKLSYTDYKN